MHGLTLTARGTLYGPKIECSVLQPDMNHRVEKGLFAAFPPTPKGETPGADRMWAEEYLGTGSAHDNATIIVCSRCLPVMPTELLPYHVGMITRRVKPQSVADELATKVFQE